MENTLSFWIWTYIKYIF